MVLYIVTETVGNGDRIAQLVIMPYLAVQWNEVTELDETKRADNGFGSTGISNETGYEQLNMFDMGLL